MWEIIQVKMTGDKEPVEREFKNEDRAIERYEELIDRDKYSGKNLAVREMDF